jgi:hypothetical protein
MASTGLLLLDDILRYLTRRKAHVFLLRPPFLTALIPPRRRQAATAPYQQPQATSCSVQTEENIDQQAEAARSNDGHVAAIAFPRAPAHQPTGPPAALETEGFDSDGGASRDQVTSPVSSPHPPQRMARSAVRRHGHRAAGRAGSERKAPSPVFRVGGRRAGTSRSTGPRAAPPDGPCRRLTLATRHRPRPPAPAGSRRNTSFRTRSARARRARCRRGPPRRR